MQAEEYATHEEYVYEDDEQGVKSGRVLWTGCGALLLEHNCEYLEDLVQLCIQQITPHLIVRPVTTMYGRPVEMPRSHALVGGSYSFSGHKLCGIELAGPLKELLETVNGDFTREFNRIYVIRYQGGHEYVAKHQDNEADIDQAHPILGLSYGQERLFRVRKFEPGAGQILATVPTKHLHALQMCGSDFQRLYTHEIVKTTRLSDTERWVFTFRKHITSPSRKRARD